MDLYFDEKFKDNVIKAWELNKNELNDVYYHPTKREIVKKCIALSCKKPLTKLHLKEKQFKSTSSEKWLEAYIIQAAKKSNNYKKAFKLNGLDSQYYFLYSQLNLTGIRNSEGKYTNRPLDCLLYEPSTQKLILWELKKDRTLKHAQEELETYAYALEKIKNELTEVFSKIYKGDFNGISEIEKYIVWPKVNSDRSIEIKPDAYKIIEYSSDFDIIKNNKLTTPWDQYKKFGDKMTIKFENLPSAK
ncbi:MAG: hypothetical protein WC958_01995 [Dehalococcoidales bacterium]